jgi:hypothetical protein
MYEDIIRKFKKQTDESNGLKNNKKQLNYSNMVGRRSYGNNKSKSSEKERQFNGHDEYFAQKGFKIL